MYGDTWSKVQRVLAIWSGFGMTLNGVDTCGDYMFSGHTVVLTILNFFITECESYSVCVCVCVQQKHLSQVLINNMPY